MATTLSRQDAEQRRLRAVALLDQGRSQSEVARTLGVTHAAVSKWVKAHHRGGTTALKAKPHPGPAPKLTDRQLKRLGKLLLRGPTKHSYSTELWTLNRIADLIESHFGVRYDSSGIWHVLKRMGWSCQKPDRRARERNEDAIVQWR